MTGIIFYVLAWVSAWIVERFTDFSMFESFVLIVLGSLYIMVIDFLKDVYWK